MPQVINTNVASLNAQRNLNRSQLDLATSLQRLSSGLRINTAKDDAAGLAISELNLTVLVLAAALPSASNVSLLAERFGADNGRIARIIMTSTTIAFVSFSALAWLLGAGAQA